MSTILKALERVEEEQRVQDAGGPAPATADGEAGATTDRSLTGGRALEFGEPIARPGEPFAPAGRGESSGWNPVWVVALGILLTLGMSWYALRDGEPEGAAAIAEGAEVPGSGAQVGPLASAPPSDRLPASMEVEPSPLDDPAAALAARVQEAQAANAEAARNPESLGSPLQRPPSASPQPQVGQRAVAGSNPTVADALPSGQTRPARGFPRSRPSNAPGMERARELSALAPPGSQAVSEVAPLTSPPATARAGGPPSAEEIAPARLAARDLRPRESQPTPAAPPSASSPAAESSLPNIASRPPPSTPAEEELTPASSPAAAKPAPAKPKRRAAALPRAPKVSVERTVWHPTAERRSARVSVDGMKGPLELKEGDAVGVLVVSEITPSSVVFLHGANRIKRNVGR